MHEMKHQTHSNFCIFKYVFYLILYTRLLMKLNLFKIILYGTYITTKISRSTVAILSVYTYIYVVFIYVIKTIITAIITHVVQV